MVPLVEDMLLVGVMVTVEGMVVVEDMVLVEVMVVVEGMVVVEDMLLVGVMVVVEDMVVVEGMVVDLVMVEEVPFAIARFATLQVKAAAVRMRTIFFMFFSFCFDWARVPLLLDDFEQHPCH